MTDAVKTTEVEDVLASIRRLVSANPGVKPDQRTSNTPAGGSTQTGKPFMTEEAFDADALREQNKLLLTPADRVGATLAPDLTSTEIPEAQPATVLPASVLSTKASALPEVETLAKRLLGSDEERLRDMVVSEIRGGLSSIEPDEDVSEDGADATAPEPEAQLEQPQAPADEAPKQAPRGVLRLVSPVPPEEMVDPREPAKQADAAQIQTATPEPDAQVEQKIPVSPLLMSLYPTTDGDKPSKSLEQKIAELEALIARSNAQFEPEQEGHGENAAATQLEAERMPWDDAAPSEDLMAGQAPEIADKAMDEPYEPAPMAEDVSLLDDIPLPFLPPSAVSVNVAPSEDTAEATFVSRRKPAYETLDEAADAGADAPLTPPAEDKTPLVLEVPVAEPTDFTGDDSAGPEDRTQGEGDAPAVEQPADEAPQTAAAAPRDSHLQIVPTPDPSADIVISEDELRDLVARMIREELQGVMGERITRNVRKLVRREIQRALANHDLD